MTHAKTGRTFYTDAMLATARRKIEQHEWARGRVDGLQRSVEWLIGMDPQSVWDFVPPHDQLRALNVCFGHGCPVHGRKVFRKGGHYPWITARDKPFKVKCPIGGELYPTNDFVPWHDGAVQPRPNATDSYIDHGSGYRDADGNLYGFVAYYVFWRRWRADILNRLGPLSEAFLLTGDERYAHRCAILLASIAKHYPHMDYNTQATHRDEPPHRYPGAILDRVWETFAVIEPCAQAYDAIHPALDGPELVAFLHEQGIDDVRRHIEDNLLWVMVDNITGGRDGTKKIKAVGNFGMHQRALATLALVLDNTDSQRGMTSREMIDWIMTGPGEVEEALWNRVYRDGHGGESSPSYSSHWAADLTAIGELLSRAGYRLLEHPKMRNMARVNLDMAMLGECLPSIGDCGSIFGAKRAGWKPQVQLPAFEKSGEPRLAKALMLIGYQDRDLWRVVSVDKIREASDEHGDWPRSTRHLPGYGLTIAESDDHPVGVSMYYGYAGGGHGHRDRLTIEMFAFGHPMLTEWGYPVPMGRTGETPKRFYWSGNNICHYAPVVNRTWQQSFNGGRLNGLVATPQVKLFDGSASGSAYPRATTVYRRTAMLIENPDGESPPYLLDIFRIDGGWEHTWSFHGPPFEQFATFGVDLGKVRPGTLAGEDVPFGSKPPEHREAGFQWLSNVQRASGPNGNWGARWSKTDENLHLRMTMLTRDVHEVVRADAEPQLGPRTPESMPYVLAFRRGDDPLASQFVSVIEPYQGASTLGAMRRLDTRGTKHAVAVEIETDAGTHTVLSNLQSTDELHDDHLRFRGEAAMVHESRGALQSLVAVNVRELTTPQMSLRAGELHEGRVRAVSYSSNTITLDRKIDRADMLVGSVIILDSGRHRTSYEITDVSDARGLTTLHFGHVPMIVGVGKVSDVDARAGKVTTSTSFGRFCVDGAAHAGRRLLSHDRKTAFQIEGANTKTFRLRDAHERLPHVFDPDDDAKRRFWIADVGVNDQWSIPAVVTATRSPNGQWQVRSSTALQLTIAGRSFTLGPGETSVGP